MMRKIIIVMAGFLLISLNVYADDVTIDSSGNIKTGVDSGIGNGNLDVTGASGEHAIRGVTSDTGAAGVYGINTTFNDYGKLGAYYYGVYGSSPTWAGYFQGNTRVTGNLTVDGNVVGPNIGDITGVTAGTGLTGGATSGNATLNVNTAIIQQRVTGTCSTGSSIRTVNSDGTVLCEASGITSETDPQVGVLASGRWCTTDGAAVNCESTPVVYETDPEVGSNTFNYVPKWDGSELVTGTIFDLNGNIGIGTTNPSQRLTVSGTIESTSGGIKFPDGTVQTSKSYSQQEVDSLMAAYEARIEQLETLFQREWKPGAAIGTAPEDAGNPQAAIDGDGNAIAVWHQFNGARYNVLANRYTGGVGWGSAALIESDDTGNAMDPQIALDGSGNAIAVWYQDVNGRNNIYAGRYTSGSGWSTAALINSMTGHAYSPQIAMDESGNAIAVWYQQDGGIYNIYANRYAVGSGWGTASLIENAAGNAYYPQIAVDGSGNAIAVWHQSDGTRTNIWANRYTTTGGWGTAALIEIDNAGDASYPQIGMDGSGNAIAVWHQNDGTRTNIWANRYTTTGGWGTAALIETDNVASALSPQIVMDVSGNAIAVWYQSDGARNNIWARRYTVGSGWGTAVLIETNNSPAYYPQIAMDRSGNAIAVWYQSDGVYESIWANRYTTTGGWGTAALIETNNAGPAIDPQIAMNGSGDAVVVWAYYNGSNFNIWGRRYAKY